MLVKRTARGHRGDLYLNIYSACHFVNSGMHEAVMLKIYSTNTVRLVASRDSINVLKISQYLYSPHVQIGRNLIVSDVLFYTENFEKLATFDYDTDNN